MFRTTLFLSGLLFLTLGAGQAPTTQPSTTQSSSSTTRPAATRRSTILEPVKEGTTQPNDTPAAQFADGILLSDLAGQLVHEKNGDAAFTFEFAGKKLRMPILPNSILARMETMASSDSSMRFRVTGRTTSYRGHNHLWIQDAVVIDEKP